MSLRKSVFFSALSANSLTVIGIASSMVIARLLTPSDIGAYAIAAVFVGLAHQFRDFGTSTYLIQCETINEESLGKAFGLTVLTATGLGLFVICVSPVAARFYRSEEIENVLLVLGVNFFIVPFGANTLALLRRDVRVKERAVIDHASAITGLLASCISAYRGYGALSLAIGTLCATIATSICAAWFRPRQYPWAIRFRGLGEVTKFGASMTTSTLMAQVNRGLVELIGGRFAGLAAVGLYNKAKSVTDQVSTLLYGVASHIMLPVMAQTRRQGQDIAPIYLAAVQHLTVLAWPIFAFAAIHPLEILHIMYGRQWDTAAPMLVIMCILGIFTCPLWLWTQPLIALGKTNAMLVAEIVSCALTVTTLFGLFLYGISNLAFVLAITAPFSLSYIYIVLRRELKFSNYNFAVTLRKSFFIAAATAGTCYLASLATAHTHEIARLLVGALVGTITWTAMAYLTKHAISKEITAAFQFIKRRMQ